ncbi:cupin [Chryseobacterium glaciei]|uniref:Cupin n=1 Tax=Chryseobacterium glaciei TaxID=1685010 RepID=A0A172XQX1_9FLAO|nr:cupin domain-containing protein [Chryseobacterium glaciei]ANF49351.1 cupin [Chryseobacterium glaciei]
MNRKTILKTAFLIPVSLIIFSCDDSSPTTETGYSDKIESVTLLKTTKSWDGTLYEKYPDGQPEISVLKISVPPNKELDWHTHPVINAAYVEKGEIEVERKDNGKKQWLRQGQAVPEMVNIAHKGKTGEKGVTLIVFYSGSPDIPLSEPAH